MVWIGTWEVQPVPGNELLEGAAGAFVNVVGLSDDETKFRQSVNTELQSYGFKILNTSDVGDALQRDRLGELAPELARLVKGLSKEYPIQFDEFQAYEG